MLRIYIYFFISILIHEIAHIVVAKIYKININNLRISIFGFSAQIENSKRNKTKEKILMYLAGPLLNFLLMIIFNFSNMEYLEKLKIVYINVCLGIFNLFPILPLDGGNILKEILKIKYKNLKANKISLFISKICLAVLIFTYSILIIKVKNISILALIIYLIYLNFVVEKKLKLLERTYKILNKNLVMKDMENKEKILQ